ncbi:MAG TPA: BamA/TamA family outer membrane protein [Kiloniellales bacterium]|nr:BamA/TamA family outer membrane protein [Kiloniellales bacterium]
MAGNASIRARRPSAFLATLVFAASILCLVAGVALSQSQTQSPTQPPAQSPAEPQPQPGSFAYTVEFRGVKEKLLELVQQVSQLVALRDREPPSRASLERRIQRDRQLIDEALRSQGYYDATIDWQIVEGTPLQVVITIDHGERFTIGSFAVEFPPGTDPAKLKQPSLSELGIAIGEVAIADSVVAAEGRLIKYLQDNGYPFAVAGPRYITVDLGTHKMAVTLRADPGPYATFGPLAITGLDRLEEPYFRRVLQWAEGEPFSNAKLEEVRRRAVATGLFERVDLEPATEPAADNQLSAQMKVKESAPRTVGLGASYSTSYGDVVGGFSADFFWEHRNIFGEAEKLRIEGNFGTLDQRLAAILRKPNYLRMEQTLVLSTEVHNQDIEAYRELSGTVFGGIERPLYKRLSLTTGLALELLRVDDLDRETARGKQTYFLASTPTVLKWEGRDNIFNPTKGVAASLGVTPTISAWSSVGFYSLVDLEASTYYAPWDDDRVVLAARGRVASLIGDKDGIPASKLLYAGGGGSVRGYKFDSLGPLDDDDDALGGLSLFEASLETRFRLWEDYGLVLFIDAGQVYEDSLPEFGATPQVSAGIGFRYFTSIGPLRLDLAFPLNPRPSDPFFQFYVSVGQSF